MALPILFFVTAFFYACVGFGGGSTYSALLFLYDIDFRILPLIALTCNIIVVSGGVWHFTKAGHIHLQSILPWIILSVPAAWVGGYIDVSELIFTGTLGFALLLSGLKMLWSSNINTTHNTDNKKTNIFLPPFIGAVFGFIAGITGIGGGIFLAPVLHLLRWNDSKNISGTCSLFIFVNSLAGLSGQIIKQGNLDTAFTMIDDYWLLFPAVIIGGQIGSWFGAWHIKKNIVKILTACLVLYVSMRLIYQFFMLVF